MFSSIAGRPLVWLCGAFLMGVATAIGNWPWLALPLMLLALWDWRRALIAMLAFGVGIWHRPLVQPIQFAAGEFRATMRVISMPEESSSGSRCLAAVNQTRYRLQFESEPGVALGDELRVEGRVQPISEAAGFARGAVAEVRASDIVKLREGPVVARWGTEIASSFSRSARQGLPPELASLVEAVCFNRTSGLESDDWEGFRRFGVIHLLSASGFHVFVVAAMLLACVRLLPIPRVVQIGLVTFALVVFACAAGLRPPIVRAVIMSVVMSTAYLWRREPDGLSALGLAALITLWADPFAIADIGFHLSMLSTGALAVAFDRFRKSTPSVRGVAASTAAMAATLPITAFPFGEVSAFGLLGNLIVSPIVAAIVIVSIAAWLSGLVIPPLGEFLWHVTEPLCVLTRTMNGWASVWPGSAIYLPGFSAVLMVIGVGAAFVLLVGTSRRIQGLSVIAVVAALAYEFLLPRPDNFVVFLQVGQGDCTVAKRDGKVVMIDAGPRSDFYDAGERLVWLKLRQLGIRKIDILVVSHPDLDHIGGMAAIAERIPIGSVVAAARFRDHAGLAADLKSAELTARWIDQPSRAGTWPISLYPGLNTGSENAGSLLTMVPKGTTYIAATGDAPAGVERQWLNQGIGRADILKAGHHGSHNSLSTEWLHFHEPSLVIFSCGRNNSYGHPAPEAMARAEAAGARIWRTDRDGDLVLALRAGSLDRIGLERFDPLIHFFNR